MDVKTCGDEGVIIRVDDDTLGYIIDLALGSDSDEYTPTEYFDYTIAYWCDKIEAVCDSDKISEVFYDEGGCRSFDVTNHLTKGGAFILHDCIKGVSYELTRDKLLDGIKRAIEELTAVYDCDTENMINDEVIILDSEKNVYRLENIDYQFADNAVQFALFNNLNYNHSSVRTHGMIRIYIEEYRPFTN
ncbi:MAG: hypothetical protein Q4Q53_03165 [Methanocorpusculum sp.]|nr:hypothetical protein [Methanocorpusculum sp.]